MRRSWAGRGALILSDGDQRGPALLPRPSASLLEPVDTLAVRARQRGSVRSHGLDLCAFWHPSDLESDLGSESELILSVLPVLVFLRCTQGSHTKAPAPQVAQAAVITPMTRSD